MRRTLSLLMLSIALPICAAEKNTSVIDDVAYTKAQRLMTVATHRRLNIYCTGKGSPTVVFDSGMGDGTKAWGLVQPVVASTTRACSYDRAGLGFSDASTRPGTSSNAVDDLHRLLRAAKIKPPHVLVGHSLGGMNIKLYAETYPSDVAGMVFVDPSPEDMGKILWEMVPDYDTKYAPYMKNLQRCLMAKASDFDVDSELFSMCVSSPGTRYSVAINAVEIERGKKHARIAAWISEQENIWFTSADQVRAAYRQLGDIPLIVLTHEAFPRVGGETQVLRDAKNELWIRLHNRIASMSTRGIRRTVESAGHYIQLDQPQVVNATILEVVNAVRSR